jgi:hypothetical protein
MLLKQHSHPVIYSLLTLLLVDAQTLPEGLLFYRCKGAAGFSLVNYPAVVHGSEVQQNIRRGKTIDLVA